jgi:uncharacterized membrane protein YkvA (DUF1232 family)
MAKRKERYNPLAIVMGAVFAAVGLAYLFWGLDLLPDSTMLIVGYLDDAVVMIALYALFWKFTRTMK